MTFTFLLSGLHSVKELQKEAVLNGFISSMESKEKDFYHLRLIPKVFVVQAFHSECTIRVD